jgi:hypothetical protein
MRAFSLILNVFALCVIGFDAIVSGRFGYVQMILVAAFAVGTLGLYVERPFWFRTLAIVPLAFVAIFGLIFLALFLYNPGQYGGWLESIRVVCFLAAIGVNVWAINELAPRSDRASPLDA